MNLVYRTILIWMSLVFVINAQPNAPQNLNAESVKYDIEGYTGIVVSLRWEEATDGNSDPVPIYTIYRFEGSSSNPEDFESLGSVLWKTGYIDNNVEVGSTYSYFVTATASNMESAPSEIVEITVSEGVEPSETAMVSGNVKDELTNEPIEGVNVVFFSENAFTVMSATTDAEGNYSLELIPGDYKIYFRALQDYFPEFYDNVRHVWEATEMTFEANQSYSDVNALLSPIAPGPMFNLSGSVKDIEGNPIDAMVRVKNTQNDALAVRNKSVRTDDEGNFLVEVPEGSEVILYAHPMDNNFSGEFYENAYSPSTAMVITVDDNIEGINFVLEPNSEGTAAISGGASNSENIGVQGMVIARRLGMERFDRHGNLREFTDEEGNYAFSNLPAGDYILFFLPEEGYLPTYYKEDGSMTINWKEADVLTLDVNSNLEGINFSLMEMPDIPEIGFAEIGGTILDSEGQPIQDAYVYVQNQNDELVSYALSDQYGEYTLTGLAPGSYNLSCDNYLYSQEENTDVTVSLDQQTTVNFTMTPDIPVSANSSALLTKYQLMQNYPNPFNPSTTIQFSILEMDNVKLKIYDILGSEIRILVNEEMSPGVYSVQFNADDLPSGLYIYELTTSKFTQTKKMLLLK